MEEYAKVVPDNVSLKSGVPSIFNGTIWKEDRWINWNINVPWTTKPIYI